MQLESRSNYSNVSNNSEQLGINSKVLKSEQGDGYHMPTKSTLKKKLGETKSEYVQRLMKNKTMRKEYKDPKQRVAVAYSYWRKYGSKKPK